MISKFSNENFYQIRQCLTRHSHMFDNKAQHILVSCGSLGETRNSLRAFTDKQSAKNPEIKPLIDKYCSPQHPDFPQFLIDCSVLPDVIQANQGSPINILIPLFKITRTWCYCLHRARLRILGRWRKFQRVSLSIFCSETFRFVGSLAQINPSSSHLIAANVSDNDL